MYAAILAPDNNIAVDKFSDAVIFANHENTCNVHAFATCLRTSGSSDMHNFDQIFNN